MDEREFQSIVILWTGKWLDKQQTANIGNVRSESPTWIGGSRKRRDITLLGRYLPRPLVTLELKVPENRREGNTALNEILVKDAYDKARKAGVKYFGTWNVKEVAIWNIPFTPGLSTPIYQTQLLPALKNSDQLNLPEVAEKGQQSWHRILDYLETLVTPYASPGTIPFDIQQLLRIKDLVEQAATAILPDLTDRCLHDPLFLRKLIRYCDTTFGWQVALSIHSQKRDSLQADLLEIARLAAFIQVNKIIFYQLLYTRGPELIPPKGRFRLPEIEVNTSLSSGSATRATLTDVYFTEAVRASGNYESVFASSFADDIAFVDPVSSREGRSPGQLWADLVEKIKQLKLDQLPVDMIHNLYEEVIPSESRHELGQYYTPTEVVDLILTFCIREATDTVLDTSTGGGSFLIRAYHRKRDLNPVRPHVELMEELYGCEIAHFPAHLAVLGLASQSFNALASYPRIIPENFFSVFPGHPTRTKLPGGVVHYGPTQTRMKHAVTIPPVNVVVTNPPYIRFESNQHKDQAQKAILRDKKEGHIQGTKFSGKSDQYVYFFAHGAAFLKDGGRLGFVTSNAWMDVAYGRGLQQFFLDHFRILAIIEPASERWFVDSDIITAITVLARERNQAARDDNLVRFVWLREPLHVMVPPEEDRTLRRGKLEEITEMILSTTKSGEEPQWRIRVVRQGDLSSPIGAEEEESDDA